MFGKDVKFYYCTKSGEYDKRDDGLRPAGNHCMIRQGSDSPSGIDKFSIKKIINFALILLKHFKTFLRKPSVIYINLLYLWYWYAKLIDYNSDEFAVPHVCKPRVKIQGVSPWIE